MITPAKDAGGNEPGKLETDVRIAGAQKLLFVLLRKVRTVKNEGFQFPINAVGIVDFF